MVLDITNPPSDSRDHRQVVWNERFAADVKHKAQMWFREDFGLESDWTSRALVPLAAKSSLAIVARMNGVIAGLPAVEVVVDEFQESLVWAAVICDGDRVQAGDVIGYLSGSVSSILQIERVILNLVGRLSGIATTTRHLVDAIQETSCRIYDTRKTVPGWRLLDKYAVTCGGGYNHRMGLYDAILIKDNHLAALREEGVSPADAVRRSREFISRAFTADRANEMVVEVEVDSLGQLANVLPALPDIVLLDNMSIDELRQSVALREKKFPEVILEASGGVTLKNISAIAKSGVDRISTGAPIHTSSWLDVGLDWGSVSCAEHE
ncbi:MAG: carboxylating nicotinate-nucleotide diphosphorylase [Planctomycetaceae bacterium]|nr:carboxylating nicotinate-nucleotide diphosphorylase [Planctomycetaceae bacterium]MBT6643756.1 carboxylating nicotinate-nucleotide diphosphorylase [Planctomycetaceae bacterium]